MAAGEVEAHGNILSVSRMNNTTVIFLNSVDKVNEIVDCGVVIQAFLVTVLPLITPSNKITCLMYHHFLKTKLQRTSPVMANWSPL